MRSYLIAGGIGATLQFFLDPDLGRRRRIMARDRSAAVMRRGIRKLGRFGRRIASDISGRRDQLMHSLEPDALPPNDETLKSKVETELFRDPTFSKGRININTEHGVIVIRGEVDRLEDIEAIESRICEIAGVTEIRNLLHPRGTPSIAA